VFQEGYSSGSAASAVLRVYGIESGSSLAALHRSLISFITDVTFGYSVYSAYQCLSILGQGSDPQEIKGALLSTKRATTAELYKVKFGNPFPGPSYEVAHHCVDPIYIFDAFHDSLEAQDEQNSVKVAGITNSALR
jgi:hypothetical protein